MELVHAQGSTIHAATAQYARPVLSVHAIDRDRGAPEPLRVFARDAVGRHTGYGSLNTALSAARNISRGADRSAVVVERLEGVYQVFDAVWQVQWGHGVPSRNAPMRHFHFEDGTPSRYTAWRDGAKVDIVAQNRADSLDDATRWLVDGSRVAEIGSDGGTLY
jgi:hypothetical protein